MFVQRWGPTIMQLALPDPVVDYAEAVFLMIRYTIALAIMLNCIQFFYSYCSYLYFHTRRRINAHRYCTTLPQYSLLVDA